MLFVHFRLFSKLGGNFGPEKKYLAPPPKFPTDTLHARGPPPLSWETPPPLSWSFQ